MHEHPSVSFPTFSCNFQRANYRMFISLTQFYFTAACSLMLRERLFVFFLDVHLFPLLMLHYSTCTVNLNALLLPWRNDSDDHLSVEWRALNPATIFETPKIFLSLDFFRLFQQFPMFPSYNGVFQISPYLEKK